MRTRRSNTVATAPSTTRIKPYTTSSFRATTTTAVSLQNAFSDATAAIATPTWSVDNRNFRFRAPEIPAIPHTPSAPNGQNFSIQTDLADPSTASAFLPVNSPSLQCPVLQPLTTEPLFVNPDNSPLLPSAISSPPSSPETPFLPTPRTSFPSPLFSNEDFDICDPDSASASVFEAAEQLSHSEPLRSNKLPSTCTRQEAIDAALQLLSSKRLSPADLLLHILDESNLKNEHLRNGFYLSTSDKLEVILSTILKHKRGKERVVSWMKPHARQLLHQDILQEVDVLDGVLKLSGTSAITPEYVEKFEVVDHSPHAPELFAILRLVCGEDKTKNGTKKPDIISNIVVQQLLYHRSQFNLGFAGQFGVFLWANGAARQIIDAAHRCRLSVCFDSVQNMVKNLGDGALEQARQSRALHPGMGNYDNLNVEGSIHVEQREDGPAKVTSGTAGIWVQLCMRDATKEDMLAKPIIDRLFQAKGLSMADLEPTMEQRKHVGDQFLVHIINVLLDYCDAFSAYRNHPELQHKPRRPLPTGHKTVYYGMGATTTEENDIEGNLLIHDEMWIDRLGSTLEQLEEYMNPTIDDQLTNARNKSARIERAKDLSNWKRRLTLDSAWGVFHALMNFIWLLLKVHRGSLTDMGSLTWFFAMLDKRRLGEKKPDFHTLLMALKQIFHGTVLNAWTIECGYPSLEEFAKSLPTPAHLLDLAAKILLNHANPLPEPSKEDVKPGQPLPPSDVARNNLQLLTRDLLYVMEIDKATSDGDFGRIEDLVPQMALMFCGAGGKNYCGELLNFLLNIKQIWTPKYADIIRDNMLVCPSGKQGRAMAADTLMETQIRKIKKTIKARGLQHTWDRIGNAAAAITTIDQSKISVRKSLKGQYVGSTHQQPDTRHLGQRAANKIHAIGLDVFNPSREGNSKRKPVAEVMSIGNEKIQTAIKRINRQLSEYQTAAGWDRVVPESSEGDIDESDDELGAAEFNLDEDNESDLGSDSED